MIEPVLAMLLRTRLGAHTRLAALLLLVLLLPACASTPDEPPGSLRVMVYNIHAGRDTAGASNLERVAALIQDHRPHVVLLQEVDRGTARSGGEDQLHLLRDLTGYFGSFGKSLDFQGGEYGIAVLSVEPALVERTHDLPVDPPQERAGGGYEPRVAHQVVVPTPAGTLDVLNTHLDPSPDDHFRIQETISVHRRARLLQQTGRAAVVGGDFNALPDSRVVAAMQEGGWRDAWAECAAGAPEGTTRAEPPEGLTYPAGLPQRRIDYLFIPPELACRSARVLETTASDHRPVLFVLVPRSGAAAAAGSWEPRRGDSWGSPPGQRPPAASDAWERP